MPPRPRAVVFDLDGTLVDSLDDLTEATNRTLEAFGLAAVSREDIRARIGRGARNLVAASIGEHADLDAALDAFLRIYREVMTDRTRPYPGLPDVLNRLGALGIRRAVATNKPAAFTGPILEACGLAPHLEGWASGDESQRKPDPASITLALERAGLSGLAPEQVVYVGDMPVDVSAGRNFGAQVVGVSWGFDPDGTRNAGPDVLCDTAEALADALGLFAP
jgi:phosphoglycolate phosphatase